MNLRHVSLPVKGLVVALTASAVAFVLMLHAGSQSSSVVQADPAYGNVKPEPSSGFIIENHKFAMPVKFTTCTTPSVPACRLGAYEVKIDWDSTKATFVEVNALSTGGNTSTTLKDTTKNWKVNEWVGSRVELIGGAGANGSNGNPQNRVITANTANTLTVSPAWDGAVPLPNTTTFYQLGGMLDGGWLTSTNRIRTCPTGPTNGTNWAELHCVTFDDVPLGPTGAGNLTSVTLQAVARGFFNVHLLTPDTKVLRIDGYQINSDIVNGTRRIVRCPDADSNNSINVIDLFLIAQANGASVANGNPLYSTKKDPDESNAINVIDLQITASLNNQKCVQ